MNIGFCPYCDEEIEYYENNVEMECPFCNQPVIINAELVNYMGHEWLEYSLEKSHG